LVAKEVARPLENIDSITMYGSGNTARLTEDVTTSFKQVINGIGDSMGIDLSHVVSDFVAQKMNQTKENTKSQTQVQDVTANPAASSQVADFTEVEE